jgi:hypothetical protein
MEEGQYIRISSFQLNGLCDAYGACDSERRIVLDLATEVRVTREAGGGWWRAYADQIIENFNHYLALEDVASTVTFWKLSIVPGLLQTEAYRRAIEWAHTPNAPADEIQRRVEWAVRRQTRLEDPGFVVRAFLSEAVLRDQAGGPGLMKEQLYHLLRFFELPNVSIRVVPFDSRSILGSAVGSFVLLDFPGLSESKTTEPPIVYVEGYAGDLYLERDKEIDRYRGGLREIARVALNKEQSRDFILAVAKEYGA